MDVKHLVKRTAVAVSKLLLQQHRVSLRAENLGIHEPKKLSCPQITQIFAD
jgi:hypothetical protein